MTTNDPHPDDSEDEVARSLLDQLLSESRLYRDSKSYKELLQFVTKLRNVAPFNAMILQLQKPGVTYVASALDWWNLFERRPKEDARPLLILWPFAPVATVYDVLDTVGKPLPEDAAMFPASGEMTSARLASFKGRLAKKKIEVVEIDKGDAAAGSIRNLSIVDDEEGSIHYRVKINKNHDSPVQFTTLAHELGHLFLGHIGCNKDLGIPKRRQLSHPERELEAESVAYLVCERNGITVKSETYLSHFVSQETCLEHLDLYQIMRASNQVETVLGLTNHTKFPSKKERMRPTSNQQLQLFDTASGQMKDVNE